MVTSTRAPPTLTPAATSRATFSFGAHCATTSTIPANASSTSVEGVPG